MRYKRSLNFGFVIFSNDILATGLKFDSDVEKYITSVNNNLRFSYFKFTRRLSYGPLLKFVNK